MDLQIQCVGYQIAADWYEGTDESKIMIVLPGYSSSKARQNGFVEAMVEQTGTCALVVDFSGHGNSPFELRDTRPAQHLLELVCIFDWLKQKYPAAKLTVAGSSYGGFMAAHLAQFRDFSRLVLRAPAIYKPEAFYNPWSLRIDNEEKHSQEMSEYRQDTVALNLHPILCNPRVFRGRTLVVVHENDEVVARQTTDAYIKTFEADSYVAEDFTHNFSSVTDTGKHKIYQDKIASWLNQA